jgi:DNA-binding MarR family transcriptional regulator
MSNTVKFGGREVSLTKKGFPNLRQLTKEERIIVNEILESQSKQKLEEKRKEIIKALSALK